MLTLNVNRRQHQIDAEATTPLLYERVRAVSDASGNRRRNEPDGRPGPEHYADQFGWNSPLLDIRRQEG